MPQLDVVSYFAQFIWFLATFLGFYVILVTFFLPRLARILKTRRLKSQTSAAAFETQTAETQNTKDAYDTMIVEGLVHARTFLNQTSEATQAWAADCVRGAQSTDLRPMNAAFLKTVATTRGNQERSVYCLHAVLLPQARQGSGEAYDALYSSQVLRRLGSKKKGK
jgi:hypothetical protein